MPIAFLQIGRRILCAELRDTVQVDHLHHEVYPARFSSSLPFRHIKWSVPEFSNDPGFLKVGRSPI